MFYSSIKFCNKLAAQGMLLEVLKDGLVKETERLQMELKARA